MLNLSQHNNVEAVLTRLLRKLSVNVTVDAIISELEKHPDYPSLLSISDVLNNFRIENSAFRISVDDLEDVQAPFIAHVNVEDGEVILIDKIENSVIFFSNEKGNRQKVALNEFENIFSGVVLVVEAPSAVSSPKSAAQFFNWFKAPIIATIALLVTITAIALNISYFTNFSGALIMLSVLKTAGLITCILLLIQSIDADNPIIQKICKGGDKADCNAILSSKSARVFEGLSWSEVGFFYFAGTWLLLMFGPHSPSVFQVMAILNVISLPYTFYSIYYQARVAKQWCVLCCTVQILLWLEFAAFFKVVVLPFKLPTSVEWGAFFIALTSPVIFWILIKPLLSRLQELKSLKQQLRRFKYNTDLFNKLLSNQTRYEMPDENWSIVLGNLEANNSITLVTNPYCQPCSKMHSLLDELLEYRGDLQARIVFTANNTDKDIKTPVSRHLMALNELADKTIVKKALSDWYAQKQKNFEEWAKTYPVNLDEANYYKLDRQRSWCNRVAIQVTPTLMLNGRPLPNLYQLSDIKYMLE